MYDTNAEYLLRINHRYLVSFVKFNPKLEENLHEARQGQVQLEILPYYIECSNFTKGNPRNFNRECKSLIIKYLQRIHAFFFFFFVITELVNQPGNLFNLCTDNNMYSS